MRTFVSLLLIAFLSLLAEYYWPWWSIAFVCFFIAMFFNLKPGKAFVAGFLGVSLLWLTVSFLKDIPNHHILSQKMAAVFHLPNYILFILVCMLIGGLTGGIAAWSGSCVKRMF